MSEKFGWSYPAGCSSVPGDEPEFCEVCCADCDDCDCMECKICGEVGNPDCYDAHELPPLTTA